MSSIMKLIAQLDEEEELWKKETEKHFEDQHDRYKKMFEKLNDVRDGSEKCMNDITKGLEELVANKHTIEKALKQTTDLDGLPIPKEQQENAIDLMNKITKFMNSTELISSPTIVSPDQIQNDVATLTNNVEKELKDCKSELVNIIALNHKAYTLQSLIMNSIDHNDSQQALSTITEDE